MRRFCLYHFRQPIKASLSFWRSHEQAGRFSLDLKQSWRNGQRERASRLKQVRERERGIITRFWPQALAKCREAAPRPCEFYLAANVRLCRNHGSCSQNKCTAAECKRRSTWAATSSQCTASRWRPRAAAKPASHREEEASPASPSAARRAASSAAASWPSLGGSEPDVSQHFEFMLREPASDLQIRRACSDGSFRRYG